MGWVIVFLVVDGMEVMRNERKRKGEMEEERGMRERERSGYIMSRRRERRRQQGRVK